MICCAFGAALLREYENDQDAVPGYLHIRVDVGGLNARVKFCPFCGFEFRMPDTSEGKLNTLEWEVEEKRLKSAISTSESMLRALRFRCSHHNEAGEDVRYGCGGGETMCPACGTQCD